LTRNGADAHTTAIVHDIIFAGGVTYEALMAPIETREISDEYGGVTRMWQILLEMREAVPGRRRYFCLLCPVGDRPEWRHDYDAVRHFNREHFGFTFPCNYW
jgi:hypothetical protein